MKKLIRDRLHLAESWMPRKAEKVRLARGWEEYDQLLLNKLDEEFDELRRELSRKNINPDRVLEESSDVLEVLIAVCDRFASANAAAIMETARQKREMAGGFGAGIVMEKDE